MRCLREYRLALWFACSGHSGYREELLRRTGECEGVLDFVLARFWGIGVLDELVADQEARADEVDGLLPLLVQREDWMVRCCLPWQHALIDRGLELRACYELVYAQLAHRPTNLQTLKELVAPLLCDDLTDVRRYEQAETYIARYFDLWKLDAVASVAL